jgi:lipooligosaccharide transport system ATP-binding protein
VPQKDLLDRELKVWENIFTYGRYFGLSRKFLKPKVDELLEFAQLTEKRNAKADDLSGGMQRRLAIARGLVNEPEILLLDEPTTGLDPQARHVLWDRLFRLKEQGVTLVITTHYMDEAEQLCDRLIVMDNGKIMAEGSPAELIRQYSSKEVVEVRFGTDKNEKTAEKLAGMADRIEVLPDRILLYTAKGEELLAQILESGLHPVTSLVRRSSLEDVFLRLTGRTLVD